MTQLNQDHIAYIEKDLHFRGIVLDGLEQELVDHICSAVETEMNKDLCFIDAYHIVLKSFGHTRGLRDTQRQTLQSETKTSRLMLRNYLKIAFRNLSKQRFYSFINIAGLALGIAACLLIVLYVSHELSYDRHHLNASRIYRINGEIKFGGNHYRLAVAPAPMAATLKEEYPEVEATVRLRGTGSWLVKRESAQESFREFKVTRTDSSFFRVFTVPVIKGNPGYALKDPSAIAISESISKKYFADKDPLGEILLMDSKPHKVVAVFEDMPSNGHFQFDILMSLEEIEDSRSTSFLGNNYNTYVLLKPGADAKQLEAKLPGLVVKYVGPQAAQMLGGEFTMEKFLTAGNKLEYTLMPLTDIHLHSDLTAEVGVNGDITYVYLFSAIAIFILLIACINFMNLSTARSSNRAKEVGVRKVMGSMRSHLIRQFLMESTMLSFAAFILAVGIAYVTMPYFNSLSQLNLAIPFSSQIFYLVLLAGALVVGFMAGLYPSFFLSAFEPAKVLKGHLALGSKSGFIRGALVVFQFAISIFLIIGTFTVERQLDYIQNKKIGFNKDQVIMVSDAYALGDQAETFKNQILQNSMILSGTISGYIPVNGGWRSDNTFWREGKQPTQEELVGMQVWVVDHDYLEAMGMQIVMGRAFSKEFPSDSSAVVLNQTAVSFFGLGPDPIGKKVSTYSDSNPDGTVNINSVLSYTVIGVVADFHFESLKQNISPLGLFLGKSPGYASFRFQAKDTKDVIALLEQTWKRIAPGQPFEYTFLDESFGRMYSTEQRLEKIFAGFSALAIIIACLGLFALTAFTAEQRTKEIGIRKVLGASVGSIVVLLSKEFGKLILIAFALAVPIAWLAVDWWLKNYSYKVEVSFVIYALAGVSAFLVAWITMGYQSIKAARSNPVQSLRSE